MQALQITQSDKFIVATKSIPLVIMEFKLESREIKVLIFRLNETFHLR